MSQKEFLMGNEVAGRAARSAGAQIMYGYPITPASEIMHFWAKETGSDTGKRDGLIMQQAEDEIGAGFMLIGGVLAGAKAFTATAGPGNILMQDAFAMAEAMRLPTVAFIMQRGGPSTSTVIYSQQEVNLTCFGGNGNGWRIVYSPSSLQELYDHGMKAFDVAWRWHFPTFVLGDGYLAKTLGEVELYLPEERGIRITPTEAYLLERSRRTDLTKVVPSPELEIRHDGGIEYACFRNCLNLEEETLLVNTEIRQAWEDMSEKVAEHEFYGSEDASTLIIAHGTVASAAKSAIDKLGDLGNVALFRPITLNPFPNRALQQIGKNIERIIITESAWNQLGRLVRNSLYGHVNCPIKEFFRPSYSILPEDLVDFINE